MNPICSPSCDGEIVGQTELVNLVVAIDLGERKLLIQISCTTLLKN